MVTLAKIIVGKGVAVYRANFYYCFNIYSTAQAQHRTSIQLHVMKNVRVTPVSIASLHPMIEGIKIRN